MMQGLWSLTSLVLVATLFGCAKPRAPFEPSRQLVCEGKFTAATQSLEAFLADHPASPHASRARFFLGKAHLGLRAWDASRKAFEATIEHHPNSLEAGKSRYKLGMIALLQDDREGAKRWFGIVSQNANNPLVPEARAMLRWLE